MSDYIDVKIDVFELTDQRARILETLTPAGLIQEVLKEFDDITGDAPEKYAIYLKGVERPLNPALSMTQLDIQPQDTLVFDYIRQAIRQMLDSDDYAFLREESTGKVFDIQWQPAVIGRPDSDVGHNIILAVNVKLLPNGMTVSRKQAQITFSNGRYYIEPLAEHNPVFLNGKEIPLNSKREIKHNDRIGIGRARISMIFETQHPGTPAAAEAKSQSLGQTAAKPVQAPASTLVGAPAVRSDAVFPAGVIPASALIVEKSNMPESAGAQLNVTEYPFLLGRSLPQLSAEKEISRRHAEVTYDVESNKFFITDLDSTNGVTVDGAPIRPQTPFEIKNGSRIGLGMVLVLRFKI